MLITAENGKGYKIYDAECKAIPNVYSYDTETKEIAIYISRVSLGGYVMEQNGGFLIPKLIKFTLEGSYAIDPEGNKIESASIN